MKLNKAGKLVLKYDSSALLLSNKLIDSSFLNYKDMSVTIYKLKNKDGRIIVYEDVVTELNFEFTYSELYTLMYIFDNIQNYDVIYTRNNLKLVQILLKNKKYLNVIIQASDSQKYSYAYGFSNKEFMEIANKTKVKEDDKIQVLKHEGMVLNNLSKPLSNWNDFLIFFSPIITPLRTMGGS